MVFEWLFSVQFHLQSTDYPKLIRQSAEASCSAQHSDEHREIISNSRHDHPVTQSDYPNWHPSSIPNNNRLQSKMKTQTVCKYFELCSGIRSRHCS